MVMCQPSVLSWRLTTKRVDVIQPYPAWRQKKSLDPTASPRSLTNFNDIPHYSKIYPTMSVCVACNKPLEIEIEADEEEDYDTSASSSGKAPAAAPETVPDDVFLQCGCHFHWYVRSHILVRL
jgi:hypothetical protein